ncbi:rhomboid family intramembrane serine protease [Brevundimonas sp. A19_0]|uniref:rhomboid family intramembrane serine protease n=1 Tax=Brevundimonas sp. A19_0 TaxID=2821087 RepID=UPI001ADBA171|nr:rhomboid family intramembrane serine protease [Brevundimonas sp. A19_0]MBO9502198.1 rhomboid family intramembrane serine protease [Brevundimonas sp. A19_0]
MNSQPWGSGPLQPQPPVREPILKIPAAALFLALSMPLLYAVQLQLPDGGLNWAFYPADLARTLGLPGLVTAMLLHASWSHAALNAVTCLCFAPPVARMLPGGRGAAVFLLFYTGCGIVASLGYGLLHLSGTDPMVGASGAVSGLLGAALRLMGRPAWAGPGPMKDRRALTMLGVLMAINVAVGLIGYAPGTEGARIAWEAHAAGMLVGYLTVGPLFRRTRRWLPLVG